MSADNVFYKAFIVDPVSALGRFNPERIIFIEPGNRDDGAPFRGGPDDPRGGREDSESQLRGNERVPWKIVGWGRMRQHIEGTAKPKAGAIDVMLDTQGFVCSGTGTSPAWLLAPFVDPSVKAGATLFMKSLAAARGQTVAALKKWLRSTGNVEKLLTVNRRFLAHALSMLARRVSAAD